MNLERQRQRGISIVREAVEAARDNLDPPDSYFQALSDSPEEFESRRYWDLTRRADQRTKSPHG